MRQSEDHCAGLCGYGTLGALVDLFERRGEAWVRTPTTIVRNLDEQVAGRGV